MSLFIPADATHDFDVDTTFTAIREGTGPAFIACEDNNLNFNGVTGGTGPIDDQYKAVTLIKRRANTWVGIGGIGTVG